jgi:hypothetical protein
LGKEQMKFSSKGNIMRYDQYHYSFQTGAVLIILLIILVLGTSAYLLSELNNRVEFNLNNQSQTIRALGQAKEAVLGYALNYVDRYPGKYGFLPCPDMDDDDATSWEEGVSHGNCGVRYESQLGRFPWRTLGLPPLYDGTGECLWYAVAGSYKASSSAQATMLNEDSSGSLEVLAAEETGALSSLTGSQAQDLAVAVIIAPGKMIANQSRITTGNAVDICGGHYGAISYLEKIAGIDNAQIQLDDSLNLPDKIYQVVTSQDDEGFINDRFIYITREELFSRIRQRTDFMKKMQELTRTVAKCIANYATSTEDKRLPWAAPVTLSDYRLNAAYNDNSDLLVGRVSNIVNHSDLAVGKPSPTLPDSSITQCDASQMTCLISNCEFVLAKPELEQFWKNWKDHLFYAVAEAYNPAAALPIATCDATNCLRLKGDSSNFYAAIVLFAGQALDLTDGTTKIRQIRTLDNKNNTFHYLEGLNATQFANGGNGGSGEYQQWQMSDNVNDINNVNDILYCIRGEDLRVTYCGLP